MRSAIEDVVVGDIAIETAVFEGTIYVDTVAEYTAAAGVTIDSCLIKDGVVSNAGISQSSVTQHNAALDHGVLAGIGDDDHSIYALLAGRAGGQTLIGGTAASENLTLQSTSHATRGLIVVSDILRAQPSLTSEQTGAVRLSPTVAAGANSEHLVSSLVGGIFNHASYTGIIATGLKIAPQFALDGAGGAFSIGYGARITPSVGALGCSFTDFTGLEIWDVGVSATISTSRGAYVRTLFGSNTNYGILVADQSQGTTNYAIYTGVGLVRLGDAITVTKDWGAVAADKITAYVNSQCSAASANARWGLFSDARMSHSSGTQSGEVVAGDFLIGVTAAGTVTGQMIGVRAGIDTYAGASIANAYYFRVDTSQTGDAGVITNLYGLYVPAIDKGITLNYAIYTNEGLVRFGDDVYIASGKVLKINSIQVLSAQGAVVADATGAGDVVAQLNTLLARCRAHGLIAT